MIGCFQSSIFYRILVFISLPCQQIRLQIAEVQKKWNKQENTAKYGASGNQLPYTDGENLLVIGPTLREDVANDRFGLNSKKKPPKRWLIIYRFYLSIQKD